MLTPEEIEDYGWRLTGGAEAVLMAEVLDLLVSRFAMVFSLDIEDVIALNAVAAVGGDLEAALSALIARYNPVVKAEAVALTYELLERGDALEATRLSREFGKAAQPLTEQAMQAAVGVAQIVGRDNVSMGQLAEQAWWKACTRVTLGCMSGEKSLDELIAEGVGYLAAQGVSAVTYVDDAGNVTRTDSVDVAVRRHAITQANQAGGRMTIQRMQEFGHDLVQTTAHMGARPTHEPWQGRAFSLSGPREVDGVTYPNFYEETGYGTVSGLQGANCRHTFYSYFPGDPLPERPDPEENAERYRAEQKQRRIEREIRRCKRDIAADEAALETLSGPERTGAVEERLTRKKARLKGLQAKMREHVGGHDYLVRQPKREKGYMGRIEKHEAKDTMRARLADARPFYGPSSSPFQTARSFEDLERMARERLGIRLDASVLSLDFESVRSMMCGFDETIQRFGIATGTATRVIAENLGARALSEMRFSGTLCLNARLFDKVREDAMSAGRHEGGHLLEVFLAMGDEQDYKNATSAKRIINRAVKEYNRDYPDRRITAKKGIDSISISPGYQSSLKRMAAKGAKRESDKKRLKREGDALYYSEGLAEAVDLIVAGHVTPGSFLSYVEKSIDKELFG